MPAACASQRPETLPLQVSYLVPGWLDSSVRTRPFFWTCHSQDYSIPEGNPQMIRQDLWITLYLITMLTNRPGTTTTLTIVLPSVWRLAPSV